MGILTVLTLLSTILTPFAEAASVVNGGVNLANFIEHPPAIFQSQRGRVAHRQLVAYRYSPRLNGGGSVGYNRDIARKTD